MKLTIIVNYWKNFVNKLNSHGVPLPTIRDPLTGRGSISLTLVFISFNAVLVGLVGKWSGALGGVDIAQALNLFYACAALYWGRKFQGKEISFGDSEGINKKEDTKRN
jgi:hypothetical protein